MSASCWTRRVTARSTSAQGHRIVPRLRARGARETHEHEHTARGAARREDSTHDWRISPGTVQRRSNPARMSVAMSFAIAPRRAPGRPCAPRPRVARRPARHRDAGGGVRQAARRPVRVPARVRSGRRRDVGALHLHGRIAALGVEARRTASCRTGRRTAAGTTTAARPIRSPTSRRCCSAAEPVDAPEIGEFWSGAVGYFGYDVARVIERLPDAAGARRRTCPTRCSSSPTRS